MDNKDERGSKMIIRNIVLLAVAVSLAQLPAANSLIFKSTAFPDGLVGVGKAYPGNPPRPA